ncbi:MAG: branched-chain amino acid transaminase [Desulfovibrionaceae bacterium]
MVQKSEKIWFDGKLVPWDQAQVHVLTHALHYGTAVFEGIRAYECSDGSSAVFRLDEHMQRLVDSARILGLKMPFTKEQMVDAAVATLVANKLPAAYVRPLVFVGDGAMGVFPGENPSRVIVATWPWGAYLGAEALDKGISVRCSSFTRFNSNAMMSKSKSSANYINSVLAKTEAINDGFDEAIMLDPQGAVAEGSGENLFMVRKGVIKTPPLVNVLEGFTRDSVITLARDLGYEVREEPLGRDMLYVADEIFFTGTAAEITPIRAVDRRQIGAGHAGPVAKHLQAEFFKIVQGENPKYAHWLHRYSI